MKFAVKSRPRGKSGYLVYLIMKFVLFCRMKVKISESTMDKALVDSVVKVVNDIWSEVYDALKPSIEKEFGKITKDVMNKVFAKTPYADLFEHD